MLKIDLMIFDLDGTLVDSKQDIALCVNLMLEKMGHPARRAEEIYSFIGLGVDKLIEDSLATEDQAEAERGLKIFKAYMREHLLDTTQLYPGVKEILEHFREKNKVIISNRDREYVLFLLKGLGIERYFKMVLGGDEVACRKPSSCPIDRILNTIKIPKEAAIITGDMNYDIASGKEAGVHTCAVTYGIGNTEDLRAVKPDFMIDSLPELKKLID